MDPTAEPVVFAAGVALVTLLVVGRFYAGESTFRDRGWFWSPIRRFVVPLLHRVFQRVDEAAYAETNLSEREFVGTIDRHWRRVRADLLEEGYQYQPLASLATTADGRVERASLAWYHGPKPFPGAPEWLRERQVHVRLVNVPGPRGSRTDVHAHEEANPWRPTRWRDHYRAESVDVELGVAIAAYDLGLQERLGPVTEPHPHGA